MAENSDNHSTLNNLMTEIYDTVTAACVLSSPVLDDKSFDHQLHNTSRDSTSNRRNSELDESDNLQLVRNLTEKRKRYVRRVTSYVSIPPPTNSAGSIKYASPVDAKQEVIYRNPSLRFLRSSYSCKENFNKIKSVFESEHVENQSSMKNVDSESDTRKDKRLFETCALIGMNFSTNQGYVKYIFPENATLPPQLELLVFPELDSGPIASPSTNSSVYRKFSSDASADDYQLYSLVLTNEDGCRSYCYCRRVVPEGFQFCLPLAYCIITPYRAPSFYYNILKEIESHHGSSDNIVKSLLTQLHKETFPKPGHCMFINYSNPVKGERNLRNSSLYRSSVNLEEVLKSRTIKEDNSSGSIGRKQSESLENILKNGEPNQRRNSTDLSQKFPSILSGEKGMNMIRSLEKMYGESLNECKNSWKVEDIKHRTMLQPVDECHKQEKTRISLPVNVGSIKGISLKRPIEPRFDEDNLSILFNTIHVNVLIKIFGSLLLERKVILVGDKLSKLSSCIEGLQSILYPFIWQHTLISTIPAEMRRDIFEAPVPMIAGIYLQEQPSIKTKRKSVDESKSMDKNNCDISKSPTLPNISSLNVESQETLIDDLKSTNFDEGMVIDISCRKSKETDQVIRMQGDESTLLPPALAKKLRAALQHGPCISTSGAKLDDQARKSCNILVSEAFLRFFAEFLIGYKECLNIVPSSPIETDDGANKSKFDRELFIKRTSSKHVQYFLEWFTETAMFQNFVRHHSTSLMEDIPYPDFYEVFEAKIKLIESNKGSPKVSSSLTKNNYKTVMNKKMKVWRDKLRDFIH